MRSSQLREGAVGKWQARSGNGARCKTECGFGCVRQCMCAVWKQPPQFDRGGFANIDERNFDLRRHSPFLFAVHLPI